MTAIAEQLDRRLKAMPADKAASVSKLVLDLLEVVEGESESVPALDREAAIAAHRLHIEKVLDAASELDWSDFKRPDQGISETREDW